MHRDLKTPNLLLNKNGELKIADFGLCCLGDEGQSNQVMEVGTLRWMAPEILLHCSYDNSADIYSLGIILWEMLTKQVPFLELQQAGVLSKATMLTVAKEFLRPQFPSRTPKEIKHIINECWHPVSKLLMPTMSTGCSLSRGRIFSQKNNPVTVDKSHTKVPQAT